MINQMRVQLQQSRAGVTLKTHGIPIFGPATPGIGVRQVQAALARLFAEAQILDWFPNSQLRDLRTAIIRVSQALNRYPPGGIIWGGNIEREEFGEFRVDIENLRGHNLRFF